MITGIGVDVITVERIARIWETRRMHFAHHVLTAEELDALPNVVDPARWIAKRWAAKEAFAKAAGTGMRAPLRWSGIGVRHDDHGRPELAFMPFIQAWLARRGIERWHLSLSDERDLVCAMVILETPDRPNAVA
jgi:holo-[acyl-carrier protein] synthase